MANPYGIKLDGQSLRWAAAEGVPELVIAADLRRGSRRGCRVPGDTFFFGNRPSWRGGAPSVEMDRMIRFENN